MTKRLLRLASRFLVIGVMAAALVAVARPAYASGCGQWYNACNDSCNRQYDQCMAEYGDQNVCQSYQNQCYAQCQAGFYDCIGSGTPFCATIGTSPFAEMVCI